jgi:heme exporter protein A
MRLSGSDLACVRGGRQVFSGLAFGIGAGEALVVTGPNGAGKSSLLRLVAGLVRLTGGKLALEGGDPELTIGEQAHYVGHQDALKPSLGAENLAFWAIFCGGGAKARPGWPRSASTGSPLPRLPLGRQRRRLSLARLIACPRPIWLLDEPTSALDAAAQACWRPMRPTRRRRVILAPPMADRLEEQESAWGGMTAHDRRRPPRARHAGSPCAPGRRRADRRCCFS